MKTKKKTSNSKILKTLNSITLQLGELEGDVEKCWRAYSNLYDRIKKVEESKPSIDEYKLGDYVEFSPIFDSVINDYITKGEITGIIYAQNNYQQDTVVINGRLEVPFDEIKGYAERERTKYKVGDYVEFNSYFYDVKTGTSKGKIVIIHEKPYDSTREDIYDVKINDRLTITDVNESDIIGYAKKDLLTLEEKEYLSAVIKPFRDEVEYIVKKQIIPTDTYIKIQLKCDNITLPYFKKDSMYKGIEADKEYTLKELGLE